MMYRKSYYSSQTRIRRSNELSLMGNLLPPIITRSLSMVILSMHKGAIAGLSTANTLNLGSLTWHVTRTCRSLCRVFGILRDCDGT